MKTLVWCFLLGASFLSAQSISVGVKGGGFFTKPAERADDSRPYVVGPSFEIGLPARFAVEVNALYSRFGTSNFGTTPRRGHSWEFPVLGKYYFADRDAAVRPYASSGFAFRNIWFDENNRFNRNTAATDPAVGAVMGGGAMFKVGFLRLSPEIRYTRWGGYNFPATNPNQLQGLLGITF